jgi:hypothetical protein
MGLIVRKLKEGGIRLEDAPQKTQIPTRYVDNAVAEGWMARYGERAVVRPAGPTQDKLISTYSGTPHTFVHCDSIGISTVDADYMYKVVHQPDKYVGNGDLTDKVTPEIYEAGNTRVDHFYGVELAEVHEKGSSRG